MAYSPGFGAKAHLDQGHEDEDSASARPLSGLGTTRQNRRLQLRNAGFRGAAVPSRKVTPKSTSSRSNCWSSVNGIGGLSDAENVSPASTRVGSAATDRRVSSGILQEIGNTGTLPRPKKPRQRITSAKLFVSDTPAPESAYAYPMSPPPPKTSLRPRSAKNRAKMSQKRRSLSAETSKYIEHLEAELAASQSHLSSVMSPTVTREQSSKMRHLNAETRQLHDEIAEWEAKYEQRVQEAVDEHFAVESGLRNRIKSLEDDAEETKFKMEEVETQLESTAQNLQAVETANVNLEKRLEIMSELLATSPSKIDLHAETPGRARTKVRPKSMLPRFPTASSLMGSPERQPRTQPTSPLLTFTNHSPGGILDSPIHPLDFSSSSHSDLLSEASSSVFDEEASANGDSMTSQETFDGRASFNPWNLPPVKERPVRRMRRFGAGSLGPKPLILPHGQSFPLATAPPLERSETTPMFFPMQIDREVEGERPVIGRRRASTTANEMTITSLAASPFPDVEELEFGEDGLLEEEDVPASVESQATTRDFTSFGSTAGRNLMDELLAVRSNSIGDTEATAENDAPPVEQLEDDVTIPLEPMESAVSPPPEPQDTTNSPNPPAPEAQTLPPTVETLSQPTRTNNNKTISVPTCTSSSIWHRFNHLFSDLYTSPLTAARYLLQTASARMPLPRPLHNVQWWLVGVLMGPMARRRMLAKRERRDVEDQCSLLEDDGMAYGAVSPACRKGRKGKGYCVHQRRKHSPWLWIKFSITLAFAVGAAFKDGPGSLLRATKLCACQRTISDVRRRETESDGS